MGENGNNILGGYYVGGLSSSASSTISSNYYPSISTDPYNYTIKIDTEDAKKQILDAVKDEMKKDEDVNYLLEIAKAILLDYVSKTIEKPEVIFEDLNNKLKKKDEEIELLKARVGYLESRLSTLEASKWVTSGSGDIIMDGSDYTTYVYNSNGNNSSSQTI